MNQWKSRLLQIAGIIVFATSLTMIFHPDVKTAIRGQFLTDRRAVLSILNSEIADQSFKFVKIKTKDSIIVEVYQNDTDLKDRIVLINHKDGFFTFNGQSTRMAVDDIDGDAVPELLIPSFDSQLVSHLNVYKFNSSASRFERVMQ